jgi:hypothetical protein
MPNLHRLYDERTSIIICYEFYEGDIEIYPAECVFQGTNICPAPSDVCLPDKRSLEQMYYDTVKEYLLENAFMEDID